MFPFMRKQSDIVPIICHPSVVHLDLRISPQIIEKVRNDPNYIFRAWGKMIPEKT
jgi:hypothetical protein